MGGFGPATQRAGQTHRVHEARGDGDVLFGITTSGNSANVLAAAQVAHERGMKIVALTGKGGGRLGELCRADDVHICVPHSTTTRIQETHILAIHCLCDAIDCTLLGDDE